ncbi:MAG: dihydrolipoamide acetyltransferase family protein [Gudongella sp.]|nr:dihydrolipoamide acetyltransferase family protein [Gudongella sp.]
MKFEFKFPDIGEGIHEGVITKWLVEEGNEINEGDSVAEVETDKVTTEIPSPRTGKVLELLAKKGDTIHVGQVFITIETEVTAADSQESIAEPEAPEEEETAGVVGEVIASSEVIPSSTEVHVERTTEGPLRKVLATPVARKLAKDLGVDISLVKGTGPNGRIMKDDIYSAAGAEAPKVVAKPEVKTEQVPESPKAEPVKAEPVEKKITVAAEQKIPAAVSESGREERIPLTRIRKTILERMTESRFTIPHTTAMDEIDISKLYELRARYKDELKEEGVSLTYLPFIIKASITALKELPEFNSSLDSERDELVLKKYYDIGIATDTERGLMVPVIREADRMSVTELANAVEMISTKAKENRIELHELKGSTFSITNYGSIGGYFGIPIINYPESAILGLGRVTKKPIVRDDEIVIAHVLPLSLSYDHRIIDGASGARFLNILKRLLQDPEQLLLRT